GDLAGGQEVVDPLAVLELPPLDLDGELGPAQREQEVPEGTGHLGVGPGVGVVGHADGPGAEGLKQAGAWAQLPTPGRPSVGMPDRAAARSALRPPSVTRTSSAGPSIPSGTWIGAPGLGPCRRPLPRDVIQRYLPPPSGAWSGRIWRATIRPSG